MSLTHWFRKNSKPQHQRAQALPAPGAEKPWLKRRHPRLLAAFGAAALTWPWVTVMNKEPVFRPLPPAQAAVLETAAPGLPAAPSFPGSFFHRDSQGNIRFEPYEQLPPSWQRVFEQSAEVRGFAGASGKQLYEELPPVPRACVLNLFAKSQATVLPDGSTVLTHLQGLKEIRQDRIFVMADRDLAPDLDASARTGTFYHRNAVDSMLHSGHGAFLKYGSYKTHDPRGNLDITMTHDDDRWMAEIDIDYYQRGIRHVLFEVTYNHMAHARTNPFAVEKILVQKQGIDPGYKGPK